MAGELAHRLEGDHLPILHRADWSLLAPSRTPMAYCQFMSERTWLRGAVIAVAGGLAGGLVVWLLTKPPDQDVKPTAEAVASAPSMVDKPRESNSPLSGLERRVAQLERQIGTRIRLRAEVERLAASDDAEGDNTEGRRQVPVDSEDPAFELAVRSVIDRSNYERDQSRRDERAERREDRVAGQVDHLTEQLGLSDEQVALVEALLLAQMETFGELRDSDDRPRTRREWRERTAEIRAEMRSELAGVLDEDQLEKYDELQEDDLGRRGRPGR